MKIVKQIVPENKYAIKCPYEMTPTRIVVHNTANDASARNEISYMTKNDYETSFHYAVDDIEVVQGIEEDRNAWHASDGNGKGNREGIAIEICYSKSGGDRFIKAEQNAVELIVQLLKERGWGVDRVKKHQDWSGKYCPHRTLDLGWNRFIKMIECKLNEGSTPITTKNEEVNVYYQVKTKNHGWLPQVKNLEDYAGWQNSPIIGLAIKVDRGSIKYRVHLKNKGWLGYVTGYNINDVVNGYAGNGKDVIDAVEVYYNTPNNIRPFKKAKYKINNYSWQYDNEKTKGQDGYAGAFGVNATKFQIVIE
jgi:N-acetylmuramoyl-L-alanine amidase CwlA